jgi:hypothetical protein
MIAIVDPEPAAAVLVGEGLAPVVAVLVASAKGRLGDRGPQRARIMDPLAVLPCKSAVSWGSRMGAMMPFVDPPVARHFCWRFGTTCPSDSSRRPGHDPASALLHACSRDGRELGDRSSERGSPVAEWIAEGALVSAGSDYPVGAYDAMASVWGMATRSTGMVAQFSEPGTAKGRPGGGPSSHAPSASVSADVSRLASRGKCPPRPFHPVRGYPPRRGMAGP